MSGDQLNLDAILAAADPTAPEAWTQNMRDQAFVIHAREDVPALVAEVRRLRDPEAMIDALIKSGWLSTETYREGDSSSVRTTLRYYGQRLIDEQPV